MTSLVTYLKKYKGDALIATISVIIIAFATLWQPRILQEMITAILQKDQTTVLHLGIQLIALAILGIIAGIINTIYAAKTAQEISADMREKGYRKIQTFSFGNIEKFSASNLVIRLTNDINQVQLVIMSVLQQLTRIPILFVGAFVLAIVTMPRFWWIIVLMLVLIVVVSVFAFTRMGKYFEKVQTQLENNNTLARENLMGMRVVKSFVQEKNQIAKFSKSSDEMTDTTIKIGNLFSILMPAFFLVGDLAVAGSIMLVGTMITKDPSMIAAVQAFISYLMQILFSVVMGGFMMTGASRAFVSLRRLQEIYDTKPDLTFPDVPETSLSGDVQFENVTFAYPGDDEPVLQDISFKVKAGEMIGIVGATGSGKTTLAQLIPRLYDPNSGVVKVGGRNIKDVNEKSLRNAVSFILQRSTLFSGTISHNLKQGKQDATLNDMKWAANVAQAAEFIEKLDEQYDAKVEERSANFSGGQKQRLSITRGVIKKPDILIMDDSTSALDARSEKLVQQALENQLAGTTTIIIAEKISSIIKADRILVLDKGHLVGEGTHQELVKNNQIYQEIYQTQKALEEV
ncbi:ABC transporter ATP-binding protein permease [Lapidilactobacillus dextrinicus DSM 20335]|uniref:ABC transporter ATP-binding protein permease n=1 Tax=Lapidilactobacillus dextrinicus DSM 20335 TaxID=1423738 RepID=A0A0R2BSL9_9LACO|nr:ABC transporter ATP-binding protein [Lapidilactobacillus dextrinicus]KRM78652.1 ABC transporter ATP-binding protein permease [Lapidilactobacillus dextrinicus DSM 20335]QFG46584.1 ABC transporter ATP-binding protein [Lapidilactobacillus dextrinicus]